METIYIKKMDLIQCINELRPLETLESEKKDAGYRDDKNEQ